MNLNQMVSMKRNQWGIEAILFNAAHGRSGGEFVTSQWANGEMMVGPVGCRANQEITLATFRQLKAQGWTWCL